MADDTKKKLLRKPGGKTVAAAAVLVLAGVAAWLIFGQGLGINGKNVDFKQLTKDNVPKTIETDVVPEYRELERALGCLLDGSVYVVVTRGEKPTAGYKADIEKMTMEKTKDGKNLKVYALFTEPAEGESVSQVITYPYAVAHTELTTLPDTIELVVKYAE